MGQVLHGSATTTEAIRQAIQNSQESLKVLAERYGTNPKTVEDEALIGNRRAVAMSVCETRRPPGDDT